MDYSSHTYPRELAKKIISEWRGGYKSSRRSSSQGGSYFSFERSVSGEFTAGREPAYQVSSCPNQSPRTRRDGGTADGDAGVTAARRKKIESARQIRRLSPCATFYRSLIGVRWDPKEGFWICGNILELRVPAGLPESTEADCQVRPPQIV